jgi:hypothetical protein
MRLDVSQQGDLVNIDKVEKKAVEWINTEAYTKR